MKPLVLLHNQLLKESVSGSMLRPTPGAGNCDGGAIGETWMARSEWRTAVMHRRAETGGGQSANVRTQSSAYCCLPFSAPFTAYACSLFEVYRGGSSGSEAASPNA